MRPNLEIIDDYLNGKLSDEEKKEIERQIVKDKVFAKEFSFMLLSKKAAKQEADILRKKEFESLKSGIELQKGNNKFLNKRVYTWVAAASIALIAGFFLIFNNNESPERMAQNYIDKNLATLPVLMGNEEDSLQKAINFYNKKAYTEASIIFEKLSKHNAKAMEYYGLNALQLNQYEKAITIFEQLSTNETYKNRAKLLLALSHFKKGENEKCYEILKSINRKDLSVEDREFVEDMAIRN
jgi:tetratricopeptide (TPR) repeat protein